MQAPLMTSDQNKYFEHQYIMKPEEVESVPDELWYQSYRQESQKEKLWRKCKENPFVPFGLAGTVAALAYGLVAFQRGQSGTQQNMMRLRVAAQGFTVLSVVLGVALMSWRQPVKESKK